MSDKDVELKELKEKLKKVKEKLKKTRIEKFFYVLLSLVVIICSICVIVSTLSFSNQENLWEETLGYVSGDISNLSKKVGDFIDSKAVETNAIVKTDNEGDSDTEKGKSKGEPQTNDVADYSELEKVADKSVSYIERLQKVQKDSSTNSVMSFIYAVLGAVLTAVGAALVGFIFKNKEVAAEARMEAEEAKAGAQKAKKEAYNAKRSMHDAIEAQKEAAEKAGFAEQSFKNQVAYQENILNIQSALIEIAYARFSLIDFNKTDAYTHIRRLEDIVKLFETEYNDEWIEKVHKDLGDFREFVEKYSNKSFVKKGLAKKIDAKNKNNIDKSVESFIRNIEKCSNIIDNAIKHCEEIMNNNTEDLI